jgi:hypothetical protein
MPAGKIAQILFHKANSTMPTPIAMSTSEAKCMVTAHICVLLYNMTYLGTTQWRESMQRLPTIPSILMIDNKATVQIACNGKIMQKTCHFEQHFHYVHQGQ